MSEFLNSLNTSEAAPVQSWAAEVAAAEAAAPAPEPVPAEPAPEQGSEQGSNTAPKPAQPQEAATEQDDRRVPLKALQEERQKRSEYERKLAEYERRFAELEQRVPKQPEAPAAVEPDPETDPIGALKHAREQLRQMQEVTRAQQYEAHLNNVAFNAASEFKQAAPDFEQAEQYALNSRAQELLAIGVPQSELRQRLYEEKLGLVDTAIKQGRNPAEAIYAFAKARGYNVAPQAAQPAPAVTPAPNPALQQAKQAVAASAAAGGAPAAKGELTDNEFANLKGAEFDAAWAKRFGGNRSSMFRE